MVAGCGCGRYGGLPGTLLRRARRTGVGADAHPGTPCLLLPGGRPVRQQHAYPECGEGAMWKMWKEAG